MFLLNGEILSIDRPFTVNGVQYPANWLRLSTLQQKEAIGIREVEDEPEWDKRFYWGYDPQGRLLPKDHSALVEQWSERTNQTADSLLKPTDWMVIRQIDNGTQINPTIKAWRESIRKEASNKIKIIKETVDVKGLSAYITSEEYASWPKLA